MSQPRSYQDSEIEAANNEPLENSSSGEVQGPADQPDQLEQNGSVQEVCARIGLVTGHGLAAIIKEAFSRWVLYYVKYQWVALLVLFSYIIVAFFSHLDWGLALMSLVVPTITLDAGYITMLVAILGTSISPYMFFWQANMEVEEERASGFDCLVRLAAPSQAVPGQAVIGALEDSRFLYHTGGKSRRFILAHFHKKYVLQQRSSRAGSCRQCGTCCKLLITCPRLTKQSNCFAYGTCRPEVCKIFPIDQRDIEEVALCGGQCGFDFSSAPRDQSAPAATVRKKKRKAAP